MKERKDGHGKEHKDEVKEKGGGAEKRAAEEFANAAGGVRSGADGTAAERAEAENADGFEEAFGGIFNGAASGAEIEALRLEVTRANALADEYLDHCRRLQAEFDNFRRRTAENNKRLRDDGITDAVKSLISVYDTVTRATGMTADAGAKEGLNMILRQFKSGLSELNVACIPALGEKFDPAVHDAVAAEPAAEGVEPDTVTAVLADGFTINGRVLRPASVKIAS
jgi:molecular chaperone GrpE